MVGFTEIDLDVGCQREALVLSHFFAAIPGQRFIQFPGQLVRLLDQRIGDRFTVPGVEPSEHDVARVSFDQSHDVATAIAKG